MGQVDTLLKYGPYNTYHMDPNETLYATPFDVTYYSDIVIQLVAINPAQATSATLHLRWIDADNKKIGDDTVETFSITQVFSDWWKSFSVPSNAKKLHWWIKAGDVGFNWGCGMVSPGTMMRAFSDNVSDRTSLLTAKGLYTSTISANQILAGILMALSRLAWFDLEKPEIVMKGDDATWKASPENPLELTDANGNFIGGLKKTDNNKLVLVATALSNDPNLNAIIELGVVGGTGLVIRDINLKDMFIGNVSNTFQIIMDNKLRFSIGKNGGFSFLDKNGRYRISALEDGSFYIYDKDHSTARLQIYPNGPAGITSANGNTLGVDDQGAYKIINGTMTYLS